MKIYGIANTIKTYPYCPTNKRENNNVQTYNPISNYSPKNIIANFIPFLGGNEGLLQRYSAQLDEIDTSMDAQEITMPEAEKSYSAMLNELNGATNSQDFATLALKTRAMHEMAYTQYKQENFQEALRTQKKAVEILKANTPSNKEQTRQRDKSFSNLYADMGFVYCNLGIDDLAALAQFKAYTAIQNLLKDPEGLPDNQIDFLKDRSNLFLVNLNAACEEMKDVDGQIFCRMNLYEPPVPKNVQIDIVMIDTKAQRRADEFYEKMYNKSQKI